MPVRGFYNRAMLDYGGEVSSFGVYIAELDEVNWAAQESLLNSLGAAIGDITVATVTEITVGNRNKAGIILPADPASQREKKWLVQYHDDVTFDRYTCEVPCADVTVLDPFDRAHAQIGDAGVVDAFVAAFEAVVLSKAGNSVTIDEITFVGRNV